MAKNAKNLVTGEDRCPWQRWVPAFAGKTLKEDPEENLLTESEH